MKSNKWNTENYKPTLRVNNRLCRTVDMKSADPKVQFHQSSTVPDRSSQPPVVLYSPRWSSDTPCRPPSTPNTHISPCRAPPSSLSTVVPHFNRLGRTTDGRPVPSWALGAPPVGPRRAPGRFGTLHHFQLVRTCGSSESATCAGGSQPRRVK